MKPASIVLTAAIIWIATSATAQKVYVDHDDATDFSRFTTFAVIETGDDLKESDPLAHDRVVAAIRARLAAIGMAEAEDTPQISITYHASEEEETRFNTTHTGLAWGSSGIAGAPGISKTASNVVTYTKGTLVIDIVQIEDQKLIWRGTAPGVLVGNPQKKEKRVKQAIEKLIGQWSLLQGAGPAG